MSPGAVVATLKICWCISALSSSWRDVSADDDDVDSDGDDDGDDGGDDDDDDDE